MNTNQDCSFDLIDALSAAFGEPTTVAPGIIAFSPNTPTPPQEPRCFQIVRIYYPDTGKQPRTIKKNVTETEAKKHCSRADTRRPGKYFDGYDYMKGCRP